MYVYNVPLPTLSRMCVFYDRYFGFIVYPSNCHIIIILCDVGDGSTGTVLEPRHRPLHIVSYHDASTREFPLPSRLAGALTQAVLDDRDPQW